MERSIFLSFAVLLLCFSYCDFCESKIGHVVKTSHGKILSVVRKSRGGDKYHAFLGIPYGQPPIGKKRFKEPVSAKKWRGVRKSMDVRPCVQDYPKLELGLGTDCGTEDCLYLNVYTKNVKKKSPVIVFIHGGLLTQGNARSDYYGVGPFMDNDVVFVTFQYRLGPFGFLSFGNKKIPGNFGLKDQVLALKWVKKNIEKFGGNSSSITLIGQGAGAAAADLHIVSPLSKGLFHKVILLGNVGIDHQYLLPKDLAVQRANKLAQILGCPKKGRNKNAQLKCLQKVPAQKIVETKSKFYTFMKYPETRFGFVVEPSKSKHNFLPHKPGSEKLKIKRVPLALGVNANEGAYEAATFCDFGYKNAEKLNKDLTKNLPTVLHANWLKPGAERTFVKKLKSYYLQNKGVSEKNFDGFINMITDFKYVFNAIKVAQVHQDLAPTYFYLYNYTLPVSFAMTRGNCSKYLGVGLADELYLMFEGESFDAYKLSSKELEASEQILKEQVSFAKYGYIEENPDWVPTNNKENVDYNEISRRGAKMKQGLFSDRMKFLQKEIAPLVTLHDETKHDIMEESEDSRTAEKNLTEDINWTAEEEALSLEEKNPTEQEKAFPVEEKALSAEEIESTVEEKASPVEEKSLEIPQIGEENTLTGVQ